jgi:hypothetical protein
VKLAHRQGLARYRDRFADVTVSRGGAYRRNAFRLALAYQRRADMHDLNICSTDAYERFQAVAALPLINLYELKRESELKSGKLSGNVSGNLCKLL